MSRVEVPGIKDEVIKLLLVKDDEEMTVLFFSMAGSVVSMENVVVYSSAAFGDANRFSGRLCSMLFIKYYILELQREN